MALCTCRSGGDRALVRILGLLADMLGPEGRPMPPDTSPAAASAWSRRARAALLLVVLVAAPAASGTAAPPVYIWRDAQGGIRFSSGAAPVAPR